MSGFFLINKPKGITSFGALKVLRKKLDIKKIGHTGTLDPFATGVLIVATGGYTKLIPYLEHTKKEYIVDICLDGVTETYDNTSSIHFISEEKKEHCKGTLRQEEIEKILHTYFFGEIQQIPPRFSALKIDGRRAYDMARSGEDFTIAPRTSHIYEYEILSFKYPLIQIRFLVSAGTYIRSIAHDLGEILGCGGYASELKRTKIGTLGLENSTSLEVITPENSIPISHIFDTDMFITIDEEKEKKLINGMPVSYERPLYENQIYYVVQNSSITYIVQYANKSLIPLRKI